MKNKTRDGNEWTVIGLMSGTSLDGLDIACCRFSREGQRWKFDIQSATTIKYTKSLAEKLAGAAKLNAADFWQLHSSFGKFCGLQVRKFVQKQGSTPLLIGSHGHTIFHQPEKGFTCQIGDGAQLAFNSGITTVCDFRSGDVARGGQGAPLVPIGDQLLFDEYDACMNIGGIANISFKQRNEMVAFDICAANILFNYYAAIKGKKFDANGRMAASGTVHPELLRKLNTLPYFKKSKKKSIGREWIEKNCFTILNSGKHPAEDLLATAVEHCAFQIASVINANNIKRLLVTGGGAYNLYLLERIKYYTKCRLIVPDKKTIEFKEALIFAFLGLLRFLGETNCLKSVTGASEDSIGGAVYL